MRVFDPYRRGGAIPAAYERLCLWARSQGVDPLKQTLYGLSQDDPEVTPLHLCRFDWALTMTAFKPNGEIGRLTWPAGRIASIAIRGDVTQEYLALQYLLLAWLPRSRYQPANLPLLEIRPICRCSRSIVGSRRSWAGRPTTWSARCRSSGFSRWWLRSAGSGIRATALNHSAERSHKETAMDLGIFSVSLAVKDLKTARVFYEALGFEAFAGDEAQNYLILRNGDAKIGLFQGMFENNILTFNPTDVRAIQKALKAKGIALALEADESATGPAHIVLNDPDGNAILIDQH